MIRTTRGWGTMSPLSPADIKEIMDNSPDVLEPVEDNVNHPNHYKGAYPFEVIDVIEFVLDSVHCSHLDPFESYCLGNELKYRLRAGLKDNAAEDIAKAMKYMEFRRGDR